VIRDIDMSLFKACRDGRGKNVLDRLIGGGGGDDDDDDEGSNINVGWWKAPGGWDVVPPGADGNPTSFFWPSQPKATTHTKNLREETQGDTLLHIAIKLDRRDLLEWLSTVEGLDLNVTNADGVTPNKLATDLGKGNMYTFYFVLK